MSPVAVNSGAERIPARAVADGTQKDPDGVGASSNLHGVATKDKYTAPKKKPNIFLITTDDAAPGDLKFMPNVRKLLAKKGTTFTNAVAPTPICVPARASLLTGQYTHNHAAMSVGGERGGFAEFDDRNTLPVWLQKAGYTTMFSGKYLNGYEKGNMYVPPGWDDWRASNKGTYQYDRAFFNVNGKQKRSGLYSTDAIAEQATKMLKKQKNSKDPFYLWVNYVAPHHGGPHDSGDPLVTNGSYRPKVKTPSPAPRHRNMFDWLPLPSTPDMLQQGSNKSEKGPGAQPWEGPGRTLLTEAYQQRIEALQAVDESVKRHVQVLRRTGKLRNTLIVFSSDNGFAVGEHNILGKFWYYRETSGIPLVMRGPGIPKKFRQSMLVTNPDLAVSFAAAAGAKPSRVVDGVNVLGRIRSGGIRVVPTEAYAMRRSNKRKYSGIRIGERWTYVRFRGGDVELYDHESDPYELNNVADDQQYAATREELHRLDRKYRDCSGSSCPTGWYQP